MGSEALTQIQDEPGISVVLTDIVMPTMDGVILIRELVQIHPNVKIIASTGIHSAALTEELRSLGVTNFLTKPYTSAKLLFAVRKTIDEEVWNPSTGFETQSLTTSPPTEAPRKRRGPFLVTSISVPISRAR